MFHNNATFTAAALTLVVTFYSAVLLGLIAGEPAPAPAPVPAGMLDKVKLDEVKCDGEPVTVPKDVENTLRGCFDKMQKEWEATGKKGFMPLQRMACAAVCASQGLGLLDENGKPLKEPTPINDLINRVMPPAKQKPVADGIAKCIKKNSKKLVIKPGDCSSYGMMLFCMKETISKICKI